jgi:hypothetical protein
MRFTQYLIEESQELILILEGKGQHQLVKQYGDKILKKMDTEGYHRYGYEHYNQKGDPEVPSPWEYESYHGTPEHKTEYILKHLGIPESPDHLDISKPEHAKIWNSHVNWMLKAYATGNEGGGTINDGNEGGINRIEDIKYRALPVLKRFTKLVGEGKMKHESLAKWNHLTEVESAVNNKDPLNETAIDPSEYTKIGENEHWHVVTPHTSEAACSLGHGTKWCTTSGAFEEYDRQGPLYIAIPKNPQGKHGKREKYQIHLESNQFMNAEDERVSSTEKDSFKHRPFPLGFSVIQKIHDQTPLSDFTPEETEHLITHHPSAAFQRIPEHDWTKEQKIDFLKQGSGLEAIQKVHIIKTTDFDHNDVTHILKHTLDHYPGEFYETPRKDTFEPRTTVHLLRKYSHTLTPEQISTAVTNRSSDIRAHIASHPNLTQEHLNTLQNDFVGSVQDEAMKNPKTTQEEIINFIKPPASYTGLPASPNSSKKWSPTDPVASPYDSVGSRIAKVISHPNFPRDLHHELMTHPLDEYQKMSRYPDFQRTNIDLIHLNGLSSPHTTKEHLDNVVHKMAMSGMKDLGSPEPGWKNEMPQVRHHRELHDAIVAHPLATSDHLMTLIKTAIPSGSKINGQTRLHIDQEGILQHPNLTPEIFTALVKNQLKNTRPDQYVLDYNRMRLEDHPMFTPEHKEMLAKVYDEKDVNERL